MARTAYRLERPSRDGRVKRTGRWTFAPPTGDLARRMTRRHSPATCPPECHSILRHGMPLPRSPATVGEAASSLTRRTSVDPDFDVGRAEWARPRRAADASSVSRSAGWAPHLNPWTEWTTVSHRTADLRRRKVQTATTPSNLSALHSTLGALKPSEGGTRWARTFRALSAEQLAVLQVLWSPGPRAPQPAQSPARRSVTVLRGVRRTLRPKATSELSEREASRYDEHEVWFVPVNDESIWIVNKDGQPDGTDHVAGRISTFAPLIGAFLRRGGGSGGQLYELSPESQRQLASARKNYVGSYFRGVLRDGKGQTSHQVQLRETSSAAAPSGLEVASLMQLAAIQAQLGRMEDTLNHIALSTERLLEFVERQQRSRIRASLELLADVRERAHRAQVLADVDWQRLTGVEIELQTQLFAVAEELDQRLSLRFSSDPKKSAHAADKLDANRVVELVRLHRLLMSGLLRWTELMLTRKVDTGAFNPLEFESARRRLAELGDRHNTLATQLDHLATSMRKARPRSAWDRLWSDGLVLGGNSDERDLKRVKKARQMIEEAARETRAITGLHAQSAELEQHPQADSSAA